MPTICLPTPLRPYAGKQKQVQVEGNTVAQALQALVAAYPALRGHLFGDDDALRSFVNVYRNDEDIRHLQRGDTPVSGSDTLNIIPSIAGGGP